MADPAKPSAADLFNQANSGAGVPTNVTPSDVIGVPSDYVPPTQPDLLAGSGGHPGMPYVPTVSTRLGTHPVDHPYVEADAFGPARLPHAQVVKVQEALIKAGLLDKAHGANGIWDADSAAAWKVVLANANVYGADANDMLAQFVSNPLPSATKKYSQEMTPPEAIKGAYRGAVVSLTGGLAGMGNEAAFAAAYRGTENAGLARQRTAADQGGTYMGTASPSDAATEYILAHEGQNVVDYDLALRTMQFKNALGEL